MLPASYVVLVMCMCRGISMSELELWLALASSPLGVVVALPFVLLGISGLHHMWVHRVPARTTRRLNLRRRV